MTATVFSVGLLMLSFVLLCDYAGSEGSVHGEMDGRGNLLRDSPVARQVEEYKAYACENNEIVLKCNASGVIRVISSNYGRGLEFHCDPSLLEINAHSTKCVFNSLLHVATQCDGQKRCEFTVSNNILEDHCLGTYKLLEASYTCEKNEHFPKQSAYACENNDLELECPLGQRLVILNANYGRQSHDKCDPQLLNNANNNPSTKCTRNVKNIVDTQCAGQRICRIKASNERFTDPCRGIYKLLEVEFKCQ